MNPILIDAGVVKIYWYSIMLLIAFLIGGTLAIHEGKKYRITEDFMINYFFLLIPFSLLGARAYYVLFNLDYYGGNYWEIFRIWEGGLAIHGGLIVGILFTLIYTIKNKIDTVRLFDIGAVSLVIGQAIGRWGNFFNQEAYGSVVKRSYLEGLNIPKFIIDNMFIDGNYHHPTFLYESILCLIIFVVLIIIRRFLKYLKIGELTAFYLVMYGIVRFFVEGLRTDSLMLGDFRMAQLVSIAMILSGAIMYVVVKKGSRFADSYREEF